MKKIILAIGIISALVLSGCGQEKELNVSQVSTEKKDVNLNQSSKVGEVLTAINPENDWYKDLPKSISSATYAYNVDDMQEAVGVSQYVFIGFVEEYYDTIYEGSDELTPATNYRIQVLENMKGDLIEGESYLVAKRGGISKDQLYLELEEEDILPLVGQTYIIRAETVDGRILISGRNSNILINVESNKRLVSDTLANIQSTEIYSEYKDSVNNQSIPEDIADMIERNGEESTPEPIGQ